MVDFPGLAADVAKGAAAGSVVPGVGTALGAAGALALDLAPELARWLFGPGSEPVVAAVEGAVSAVTGSADQDVQAARVADPAVAGALRVQLAQIAAQAAAARDAAQMSALAAVLADVAGARAQTLALAQGGSALAWGAPVVSLVVLVTFGAVVSLVLFRAVPPGSEAVLNVLLGTLGAMATSVVGYWVGSSVGSARKDDRLALLEGVK